MLAMRSVPAVVAFCRGQPGKNYRLQGSGKESINHTDLPSLSRARRLRPVSVLCREPTLLLTVIGVSIHGRCEGSGTRRRKRRRRSGRRGRRTVEVEIQAQAAADEVSHHRQGPFSRCWRSLAAGPGLIPSFLLAQHELKAEEQLHRPSSRRPSSTCRKFSSISPTRAPSARNISGSRSYSNCPSRR